MERNRVSIKQKIFQGLVETPVRNVFGLQIGIFNTMIGPVEIVSRYDQEHGVALTAAGLALILAIANDAYAREREKFNSSDRGINKSKQ